MRRTTRSALPAAGLVLALAGGPLAAPALAAPERTKHGTAAGTTSGPDAEALAAAIAGLPDHDATAAVIRVAATDVARGGRGARLAVRGAGPGRRAVPRRFGDEGGHRGDRAARGGGSTGRTAERFGYPAFNR